MALDTRLSALLDQRKSKNRYRSLKEYDTTQGNLIDFSSNDYLSLTSSSELRHNYLQRLSNSPQILGSTGSRLLSGSTSSHSSLETRLSDFFDGPSALLFNSGWEANVSFFSTVPQPTDWVIYDELVHASVHSGLRSSRVPSNRRISFRHNDVNSLGEVLRGIMSGDGGEGGGVVFLALESLYSMDGDMAPVGLFLDELDRHVPRERQCVVLDEAHSTGVYGYQGRGIGHALGEQGGWAAGTKGKGKGKGKERSAGEGRVGVRLMTFGKAVGCSGAVLLCSPVIRSFLINFARPLIFSTALPHSTLLALESAFDFLQSTSGESKRQALFANSAYLHSRLAPILQHTSPSTLRLPPTIPHSFPPGDPYLLPNPASPILGLLTPTPHALSEFLLKRGLIVRPVVPPTVPPGGERVRICLRAGMSRADLDALIDGLQAWVDERSHSGDNTVKGSSASRGEISLRAKL